MALEAKKRDSVITAQQKTILAERVQHEQAEKAAAVKTGQIVSDLRLSLDEHQRVMLDSIVAGFNLQIREVHIQADKNLDLYHAEQKKVADRDSLVLHLQEFNHRLADSLTKCVKAGKPSLVAKAGKVLPWVIAGAALVFRR